MAGLGTFAACWVLGCIPAFGLATAVLARVCKGSRARAHCQRVFVGTLAFVAVAAIASLGMRPECWLTCSFTLSGMVLAVTCDFSRPRTIPV